MTENGDTKQASPSATFETLGVFVNQQPTIEPEESRPLNTYANELLTNIIKDASEVASRNDDDDNFDHANGSNLPRLSKHSLSGDKSEYSTGNGMQNGNDFDNEDIQRKMSGVIQDIQSQSTSDMNASRKSVTFNLFNGDQANNSTPTIGDPSTQINAMESPIRSMSEPNLVEHEPSNERSSPLPIRQDESSFDVDDILGIKAAPTSSSAPFDDFVDQHPSEQGNHTNHRLDDNDDFFDTKVATIDDNQRPTSPFQQENLDETAHFGTTSSPRAQSPSTKQSVRVTPDEPSISGDEKRAELSPSRLPDDTGNDTDRDNREVANIARRPSRALSPLDRPRSPTPNDSRKMSTSQDRPPSLPFEQAESLTHVRADDEINQSPILSDNNQLRQSFEPSTRRESITKNNEQRSSRPTSPIQTISNESAFEPATSRPGSNRTNPFQTDEQANLITSGEQLRIPSDDFDNERNNRPPPLLTNVQSLVLANQLTDSSLVGEEQVHSRPPSETDRRSPTTSMISNEKVIDGDVLPSKSRRESSLSQQKIIHTDQQPGSRRGSQFIEQTPQISSSRRESISQQQQDELPSHQQVGNRRASYAPQEPISPQEAVLPEPYISSARQSISNEQKAPSRRESIAPEQQVSARRASIAAEEQGPGRRASIAPEQQVSARRASVAPEEQGPERRASIAPEQQISARRASVAPEQQVSARRASVAPDEQGPSRRASIAPEQQASARRASVAPEEQGPSRRASIVPEQQASARRASVAPEEQGPGRRASIAPEQQVSARRASVAPGEQGPDRRASIAPEQQISARRASVAPEEQGPGRRASIAPEQQVSARRASIAPEEQGPSRRASIAPEQQVSARRASVAPEEQGPGRRASIAPEQQISARRASIAPEEQGPSRRASIAPEQQVSARRASVAPEEQGPGRRASIAPEQQISARRASVAAEEQGPGRRASIAPEQQISARRASVAPEEQGPGRRASIAPEQQISTRRASVAPEEQGPERRASIAPEQQISARGASVAPEEQGPERRASIAPEQQISARRASVAPEEQGPDRRESIADETKATSRRGSFVPEQQTENRRESIYDELKIASRKGSTISEEQILNQKESPIPEQQYPSRRESIVPEQETAIRRVSTMDEPKTSPRRDSTVVEQKVPSREGSAASEQQVPSKRPSTIAPPPTSSRRESIVDEQKIPSRKGSIPAEEQSTSRRGSIYDDQKIASRKSSTAVERQPSSRKESPVLEQQSSSRRASTYDDQKAVSRKGSTVVERQPSSRQESPALEQQSSSRRASIYDDQKAVSRKGSTAAERQTSSRQESPALEQQSSSRRASTYDDQKVVSRKGSTAVEQQPLSRKESPALEQQPSSRRASIYDDQKVISRKSSTAVERQPSSRKESPAPEAQIPSRRESRVAEEQTTHRRESFFDQQERKSASKPVSRKASVAEQQVVNRRESQQLASPTRRTSNFPVVSSPDSSRRSSFTKPEQQATHVRTNKDSRRSLANIHDTNHQQIKHESHSAQQIDKRQKSPSKTDENSHRRPSFQRRSEQESKRNSQLRTDETTVTPIIMDSTKSRQQNGRRPTSTDSSYEPTPTSKFPPVSSSFQQDKPRRSETLNKQEIPASIRLTDKQVLSSHATTASEDEQPSHWTKQIRIPSIHLTDDETSTPREEQSRPLSPNVDQIAERNPVQTPPLFLTSIAPTSSSTEKKSEGQKSKGQRRLSRRSSSVDSIPHIPLVDDKSLDSTSENNTDFTRRRRSQARLKKKDVETNTDQVFDSQQLQRSFVDEKELTPQKPLRATKPMSDHLHSTRRRAPNKEQVLTTPDTIPDTDTTTVRRTVKQTKDSHQDKDPVHVNVTVVVKKFAGTSKDEVPVTTTETIIEQKPNQYFESVPRPSESLPVATEHKEEPIVRPRSTDQQQQVPHSEQRMLEHHDRHTQSDTEQIMTDNQKKRRRPKRISRTSQTYECVFRRMEREQHQELRATSDTEKNIQTRRSQLRPRKKSPKKNLPVYLSAESFKLEELLPKQFHQSRRNMSKSSTMARSVSPQGGKLLILRPTLPFHHTDAVNVQRVCLQYAIDLIPNEALSAGALANHRNRPPGLRHSDQANNLPMISASSSGVNIPTSKSSAKEKSASHKSDDSTHPRKNGGAV